MVYLVELTRVLRLNKLFFRAAKVLSCIPVKSLQEQSIGVLPRIDIQTNKPASTTNKCRHERQNETHTSRCTVKAKFNIADSRCQSRGGGYEFKWGGMCSARCVLFCHFCWLEHRQNVHGPNRDVSSTIIQQHETYLCRVDVWHQCNLGHTTQDKDERINGGRILKRHQ